MRKRLNFRSPIMITIYLIAAVLLLVYFGFVFFFHSHYLPNTIIGNMDCSFRTPADLEHINEQTIKDYLLIITDRTGENFYLEGSDFAYTYVKQGGEAAIQESQNPFAWPAAFFQTHTYPFSTSVQYDQTLAAEAIAGLGLFQAEYIQAPEDAYLQINETGYEIIPEVMGTTPIAEQVESVILEALNQQASTLTLDDTCYVNPTQYTTSDLLVTTVENIERYLAATITYQIDGVDEVLSSEKIFEMLEINKDYSITINTSKIEKYVQQLATKYNTYGDKRQFQTSLGDTITIGGGDYGWVINKKKEAAQILSDLEGGVPVNREPIYEQRALCSGLEDIGNTYVEVDYTNQHMWVYKDGEMILESDLVSGDMKKGYGSPDGVFKIVYKERDAVLRGENYATPVSYFMPFAYNVGFHDADWRNSFGGTTYKTNGSHGCLNLPPDFAKILYESVATGTPVIAYYREPTVLTSENARISNAFSYKGTAN